MLTHLRSSSRLFISLCLLLLLAGQANLLLAQQETSATLSGVVTDPHGNVVPQASVLVKTTSGAIVRSATTGSDGRYAFSALNAGAFVLEINSPGFSLLKKKIQLNVGANEASANLILGGLVEEVTVTSDGVESVASQTSPIKALLTERSATSILTSDYIQNYTSPLADYGELVQMVPGTFTVSSNGVGLGQSKTYFRGFPDGDYDIDFDGVPFYDTNSPTHHSWAFFPSQWIGGVNFDRSPGSAATIGPTPFGGSIHLLSREMPTAMNIRGNLTVGSWNTRMYDGSYDSGNIGRSNFLVNVHRMTSDGYQTYNNQLRNAGSLKYQYRLSDSTILTGFAGVLNLDSNTPNFNGATRSQLTTYGNNFLLTDPKYTTYYTNPKYNFYHIPTDFEYVGLKSDLGKGWLVDIKPYTYSYYNGQHYANAVGQSYVATSTVPALPFGFLTDAPTTDTINNPYKVTPCNVAVVSKKGVSALPCGVDKLNSYRKYGETSAFSKTTKSGVFRFGAWVEWAGTNRYQIPSDPLNNWKDQTLPNFHERFQTDSYQPYFEFEWHAVHNLNITPGFKLAAYQIHLKQYADNGKTIGNLNGLAYIQNNATYTSPLPSLDVNYRIRQNWSVYGQLSTGSVVPPSSVFDYNQTTTNKLTGSPVTVETLPKPTHATTLQAGTVLKTKHISFDFDYYHTKFQNPFSTSNDLSTGEVVNYLQPDSITQGVEGEANVVLGHGLSAYLNATKGKATYTGKLYLNSAGSAVAPGTTGAVAFTAPSGLWVAQTPSDTEAIGLTYVHKGFDAGVFEKRIGSEWLDNGSYHNQIAVEPFNTASLYVNYTIRSHSRFDQTKLRFSINNVFDQHNIYSTSASTAVVPTGTVSVNGTSVANPFLGSTTLGANDVVQVLSGRSFTFSVTFGFSPKER